ncbi:hypothetical protein D1871_02295 [Nakamurella silvestris]|nr:hypothetical protein D1871_02295 [Nakamurella silvestris]
MESGLRARTHDRPGRSARRRRTAGAALATALVASLLAVTQPALAATPAAARPALSPTPAPASASLVNHTVAWDGSSMIVDGKRTIIWSGEMHPFRVPSPSLWRDVLQKMKSGGYNSVGIYVDWDYESPAPGVYDWTGVRDLDKFLDIAEEVGLYVMVRPGPYINAEASGGGFPAWMKTKAGNVRTNDATYMSYTDEWQTQVDGIIKNHQYTDGGGTVLMYQIENEFANSPTSANSKAYMAHLYQKARNDGITVPIFHNDKGRNGYWIPGSFTTPATETPANYLYGFDGYPAGTCSTSGSAGTPAAPPDWGDFGTGGATGGATASPTTPGLMAEFGGGWFVPWGGLLFGGRGYECMRERQNSHMARRYYETNVANGITINNVYMVYGGTSWGWLPAPLVYTSYDYGAAIAESRQVMDKAIPMKEIGNFLQSVPDIVNAAPLGAKTAPATGIVGYATKNADTGAQFYYVRADSPTVNASFKLPISTPLGSYNIPQTGSMSFTTDDMRILTTNYHMDSQLLNYSTDEMWTHWAGSGGSDDLALFYGRDGKSSETVFRYADATQAPTVTTLSGTAPDVTWDPVTKDLRLNYTPNGLTQVRISGSGVTTPLTLLLADETTAGTFWKLDTTSGPVLVRGPQMLRTATDENSTVTLTGDTDKDSPLEVWASFAQAVGVNWNGSVVPTTQTPSGSFLATTTLAGPPAVTLPALTNWKVNTENPESDPAFDDSTWQAATKTTSNSITAVPSGQKVLFADDYGFHYGDTWYRGTYTSDGLATQVKLAYQTGQSGMLEAWLDGTYIGVNQIATPTSSQSTTQSWAATATINIPAALQTAGPHQLAVVVRNMGNEENGGATASMKSARGLTSATFTGSTAPIAWKVQGRQGGENITDMVRGTVNNGGLYGERAGWYLPDYPDTNWNPVTLPTNDSRAGVTWYRTGFDLAIPTTLDASLALNITDPVAKEYRAQIFINGWNMGQYINNVGPQHDFVLPNGILNPNGHNTLAIAVINNNATSGASGGGLGTVTLKNLYTVNGGTPLELVSSPGYVGPQITARSGLNSVPGSAFTGTVASVEVPRDAEGTQIRTVIDWGDSSTPTSTVLGDTAATFDITGSHTYATAGNYTATVTVADAYGSTLSSKTATIAVGVAADTTAPVTTATLAPVTPNGENGWYNTAVSLSLAATDPGTGAGGVAGTEYRIDGGSWTAYTAAVPVTAQGSHTVDYRSTDAAGNVEVFSSVSFKVDTAAPTVTATASTTDPSLVTVIATDPTSGVAGTQYRIGAGSWQDYTDPVSVPRTYSDQTIEYRSTDKAGNVSTTGSVQVTAKPDTTAPTSILTLAPATPNGSAGWYTTVVSATLTATDDTGGTGVSLIEYQLDGGAWTTYTSAVPLNTDGTHTLQYRATDTAGNTETAKSQVVKVDTGRPVTAADISGTTTVSVLFDSVDATSGVASTQYRIGTGSWTTYTGAFTFPRANAATVIEFRSTDVAGNVENTRTVTVPGNSTPTRTPSTTTLSVVTGNPTVGHTTQVTVSVTSAAAVGADLVAVYDGTELIGAGKLSGGSVTLALNLGVGSHHLTAEYAGNAVAAPSVSSAVTVTVSFADYQPGSQFYTEVTWAASAGIINGYLDGTFHPGAAIERQALAAMLFRQANPGAALPTCTVKPFTDVPVGNQFCGAIKWLADNHIASGNSDGTFKPGASVDRQSTAAFLFRSTHPGAALPSCTNGKPFTDVAVNNQFCGAIEWMVGAGVTNGWSDHTFRPTASVDRQSFAAFLYRLSHQ